MHVRQDLQDAWRYAVQLVRAHGIRAPAARYASSDGMCRCCGMVFSSRILLQNHFTRGSQLCLLNTLLTANPFTVEEELQHSKVVAEASKKAKAIGKHNGAALVPAFRIPWVTQPLIDVNGHFVGMEDKRHPLYIGPGKLNFGWSVEDYA